MCKSTVSFFTLIILASGLAHSQWAVPTPKPLSTPTAATCNEPENISYRGFSIRGENDSFAKTDQNYSHGIVLTFESHDIENFFLKKDCLPWPLRWHSRFLDLITPTVWMPHESVIPSHNFVAKVAQAIYTPTNPYRKDLILDDRPYAGLVYAGLSVHQRYHSLISDFELLDTREINLGVIGPLSQSKEFQDTAHSIFNDVHLQGWEHQLKNEPAFQIAFDKKFKNYQGSYSYLEGFDADLIHSFGWRVGNIETSVNATLEGRVGWNIPNDFGSFTIRPGTDSRAPDLAPYKLTPAQMAQHQSAKPIHFGLHFFTIVDVKYVFYNFSVDGNLFHDSHRVTRQPWVSFGAIGIGLPTIIKNYGYNLAIMNVYQTSDFKERNAHHAYQAISLSIEL